MGHKSGQVQSLIYRREGEMDCKRDNENMREKRKRERERKKEER